MKIGIQVFECNASVVTEYTEREWVPEIGSLDGGYFARVTKQYDIPHINLDFRATVDKDLDVGSIYSDGINHFVAVSARELRNWASHVKEFRIPKELMLISKPVVERNV